MKDAKEYLSEAVAKGEPLPELIQRVQREAFEAGYHHAGDQMFGIAHDTKQRVDDMTTRLLDTRHHG
jgi:hypothetical protein